MTDNPRKAESANEPPGPGQSDHPPHGHVARPPAIHTFDAPYFDRLSYYYGQMLNPQQLQRAQASVYERAKLHNRFLHGWGVVCGLAVSPAQPPSPPAFEDERHKHHEHHGEGGNHHHGAKVHVEPGLAIDPLGSELLVRAPLDVDLLEAMSRQDRFALGAERCERRSLHLSLEFEPFGIEPSIPVTQDACGMPAEARFAMWRDGACARITLQDPSPAETCGVSCLPPASSSVLLARIDCEVGDGRLHIEHIDNSVRRCLAPYVPTVITGVSWRHGHHYDHEDVDRMLWDEGVKVRFSRPVRSRTLRPGVFDVLLYELGPGRSSQVRALRGEFVDLPSPTTQEFTYRLKNAEHADPGDRVVFVLRGDFVLDECCQAVDANNLGGRVPSFEGRGGEGSRDVYPDDRELDETEEPRRPGICATPPGRFGPWTSGNGVPGGTFESWITVSRRDHSQPSKEKTR